MKFRFLAGAVFAVAISPAMAADPLPVVPVQMAQATQLVEGEVRRIDKEQGKVTLRHGPIVKYDMPPMSMVFETKSASMLDGLNVGDKVLFDVDKGGGAMTIIEMKKAP